MFCISHLTLLRVSHSFDVLTAVINIRNMHTISTNQIADILHFNNKYTYVYHLNYHLFLIKLNVRNLQILPTYF